MRTRYLTVIFSVTLLLNAAAGYTALKDFKDDYRKEENSKSRHSGSAKSSSTDTGGSDECFGECLIDTFTVIVPLWFAANNYLLYAPYPYFHKDKNNFICNYDTDDNDIRSEAYSTNGDINTDSEKEINNNSSDIFARNRESCFDGSRWYLTIEGGGQYAFENGNAGFGRISGKLFRFIGPEIEAKRIVDENGDNLDYYAFGINVPIVQFSGFSPELYIQKAFLRGIIEKSGASYGVIINSYPVKPLSLMLRFGAQSYKNIKGEEYENVKFYDYEGRIGVIVNRFELFIGYRHLGAEYTEIKGPIAGIKIFI